VKHIELDGQTLAVGESIVLTDDGKTHQLRVTLGETPT
jgi:hypothetical protein